jgi:hypothetical protein
VEYARRHGHTAPVAWVTGFRVHGSGCYALSTIHRRCFRCVYQRVMQVPQGGARWRYALSCTGNYRAYTARRHRHSNNAGDGVQPTR